MKIKRFEIENYRSLSAIKIDEFTDTTIFYGDNNAGKSNVLNGLELIFKRKPKLSSGDSLSDLENFYEGIVLNSANLFFNNNTLTPVKFVIDIEVSKSELTIDAEVKKIFNSGAVFVINFEGRMDYIGQSTLDHSEFKIENIRIGKTLIYTNTKDIAYFPTLDATKKKQSELNRAFARLIDIFNDCITVVSSDRDMHETVLDGEDEIALSPKTFKKFLYSLYLSPKKFKLFEDINSVYNNPPFSFGSLSFSKDGGKLEIMVKEKDFRLPIKHLGSGALQALFIITSIVCSKSKIVCLEELEQNLSPRKQFEILKKIQAMIKDTNLSINQLIISSHSSVYAKPKLGLIYLLHKADGASLVKGKIKTKVTKELSGHLAPSQYVMSEAEFAEIKRILKEEHDFE